MNVFDLPLLGRLFRWRWGRLVFQLLLLALAVLVIYEGFTGPDLASTNLSTVLVWIHYRGFIILALLILGNLFCFACPFTLPRTVAVRLSRAGGRWPRALRNKWLSIAGLLIIFWLYEWLDLWANPPLTAWLVVAYFIAAFALEFLFAESPFCKYVCPLGAFNFIYSTGSPLQITAHSLKVCQECEGKECVNGSEEVLGCGTELFAPTLRSNMDCTLCLDCVRACPYDNVLLVARRPLTEWLSSVLRRRWDYTFLVVSLTFFAVTNAFGMVPPMFALQKWLQQTLHIQSGAIRILITFSTLNLVIPAIAILACTQSSARLTSRVRPVPGRDIAARYAPAFIPLGFGVWFAHYGFHFAVGGLALIPVLQTFLLDNGLTWLGKTPNWTLSYLLPPDWIFPLQVFSVTVGFIIAMVVLAVSGVRSLQEPIEALKELLPWALFLMMLTIAALLVFNLPMEMRTTRMMT
ncbi:MAG: FesM [Anaerolineales bacterium]|nr:FesM [Anaerolineales bacterium]